MEPPRLHTRKRRRVYGPSGMSRLERCSFVAIAALVATLAIGCSPVTQLLVVVRSDLPADDIAEVQVAVVAGEPLDGAPTTRQVPIGVGEGRFALPFSFGVLPRGGDAGSRVELLVTAIDRDGAPTVSRLVRTGFSEGRTLAVPVFLGAICRDRMCGEGLTCVDGACVSPEVPVEDLVPVRPGEELGDASRPVGSDAGTDLPDTGTPSTVGFPEPTRASGRDVSPIGIVRKISISERPSRVRDRSAPSTPGSPRGVCPSGGSPCPRAPSRP